MSEGPRFVVHEHRARRAGLHYDLRVERAGVLKDWAFRKPPPLERGVKRFGVMQQDHELFWLSFEGEIADGYGAGEMRIWDSGRCEWLEESGERARIMFYGAKLRGEYMLIKYKHGWLFFMSG